MKEYTFIVWLLAGCVIGLFLGYHSGYRDSQQQYALRPNFAYNDFQIDGQDVFKVNYSPEFNGYMLDIIIPDKVSIWNKVIIRTLPYQGFRNTEPLMIFPTIIEHGTLPVDQ